jgi:undecaprenyl-diphosphatase
VSGASPEEVRREAVAPDLTQVAPTGPSPAAAAAVLGLAGLGFAGLTAWIGLHSGTAPRLDLDLHRWALEHRGVIDLRLARAVTWGGATEVVVPLLVVVGTAVARPRTWLLRLQTGLLVTCVASTGMYVGLLVNHWVDRTRPDRHDWAGAAGGPAFPSGHTTGATLFACGLAWVLLDRCTDRRVRRAVAAAAVLWAGAVGWSRFWLGVHWPTDVLGGWLFGTAWAAAATALAGAVRRRRHRSPSRQPSGSPDRPPVP